MLPAWKATNVRGDRRSESTAWQSPHEWSLERKADQPAPVKRSRALSDLNPFSQPESVFPTLRNIHVRAIKPGDGRTAEHLPCSVQIRAQNLDGAVDSGFARSGQTVGIGATAQHGASTEADGLNDVGAATNAAVHPDFNLAVDRLDHFRQRAQRSRKRIQLPAAMIRHRNCNGAFVNRTTRIFTGQNAFHYNRTFPGFADPAQVGPSDRRLCQRGTDIRERQRTFARNNNVGKHGQAAV